MTASYGTTTRFSLRRLLGTSKVEDVDAGFAALAGDIDANMIPFLQGYGYERPPAGEAGRLWYSIPPEDLLFLDDGTQWKRIPDEREALTVDSISGKPSAPFAITGSTDPASRPTYIPNLYKPTWVTVTTEHNGWGASGFGYEVWVDGVLILKQSINGSETTNSYFDHTLGFLVPPGHNFSVNKSGVATYQTL